ncbi:hypothetical protein H1C71_015185 [Ictidomys tridecemlineatus]|nr:hypothetical protein H1C71_015185 [Ictidomys tridecemlineatus]
MGQSLLFPFPVAGIGPTEHVTRSRAFYPNTGAERRRPWGPCGNAVPCKHVLLPAKRALVPRMVPSMTGVRFLFPRLAVAQGSPEGSEVAVRPWSWKDLPEATDSAAWAITLLGP